MTAKIRFSWQLPKKSPAMRSGIFYVALYYANGFSVG